MQMKSILLTVGLVSAVAFPMAADELPLGDASKLPPAATKKGVTFDADIKPLIETSCLKCHSGEKPKGKYSMESKEKLLKGGADGAVIVVGNSAKSPLVHFISDLVEDSEMPPKDKRDKYPPLTKAQIGLVRAWIDQGAK
jgi:Planctomycete cytochrome C